MLSFDGGFLYDFVGYISSLLFLATIYGLYDQMLIISKSKSNLLKAGEATKSISLNQFFCYFFGVYSFFIYGFLLDEFNPYLVWPRLIACFFSIVLLYQLASDRKDVFSIFVFSFCSICLAIGVFLLAYGYHSSLYGETLSKSIIVVVTIINIQGYFHQIRKIIVTKSSGSLSLKMNALIVMKDISSFFLGFLMGFSNGWPLMLQSFSNGIFRIAISSLIIHFKKP